MSAVDMPEKEMGELKNYSSDHVENAAVLLPFSPEEEKRLLRKMDFRIMPLLVALYVMSFLDRVNIGMSNYLSICLSG